MEEDESSGIGERSHNMDGKMLQNFQKSFVDVQEILDQNRLLINEINQNHQSKQPENLGRNVGLIKELNNNIRRVASLYGDLSQSFARSMDLSSEGESSGTLKSDGKKRFRSVFGTMEDYGEMFQDSIVKKRGGSVSSTNQTGIPVVYKLVRVALDGRLVPATDEEMLEVKGLLENNENDMSFVPDEGPPSQLLQLERLEGLLQSETAEAYTEKLNSRLEGSNELSENEEQVQPEVLLQEPIRFSTNGCSMNQSIDVSYSDATNSYKESELSVAASNPELSKVAGEICLDNLSIKALQETFRATFGRKTTCKDKQWLKRRITMGLINSCVVPTASLKTNDDKLIGGGQDSYNDMCKDMIDKERRSNCKDKPSSPDCIKGHANDFGHSPVETLEDHYSGDDDFDGEHRSAKRVRKPTRRYIEEIAKTDEKQQNDETVIPSKDERSIQAVSSVGKVVVTRMLSLAGSRIQVPYVSHVRKSRPRENITALGEFHPRSWEMKATPEESNLNGDKDQLKPTFAEVDQDFMEQEHIDSSGDSSDDNDNNLPIMQSSVRRKHHRAWTLSEVIKLVEGVSKYGVGKWSEIKKLSFSSYAHRTSVDLKDKWRNLRKASFAQAPPSNRMGSLRKHGSMVVPSHILLQVRELSQRQSSLVLPVKRGRIVK